MKPVDNIEKSIKKLRYTASANLHDRVLGNVLDALDESEKQKPAVTVPNIWRIIIKSKVPKLATAALVIIAVIIGMNIFSGSPNGANLAWGDVEEAFLAQSWVHLKYDNGREKWMSLICQPSFIRSNNKFIFEQMTLHFLSF